jgi:hypothetical protein
MEFFDIPEVNISGSDDNHVSGLFVFPSLVFKNFHQMSPGAPDLSMGYLTIVLTFF